MTLIDGFREHGLIDDEMQQSLKVRDCNLSPIQFNHSVNMNTFYYIIYNKNCLIATKLYI